MLMTKVQLPGSKGYEKQMEMHTNTQKEDISIARDFQKHLSNTARKNGVIDQGKYKMC